MSVEWKLNPTFCTCCGAETETGDFCISCEEARCVMCGTPAALLAGEDEPVCAECRESRNLIEARREAAFWCDHDWYEVFKGVKE